MNNFNFTIPFHPSNLSMLLNNFFIWGGDGYGIYGKVAYVFLDSADEEEWLQSLTNCKTFGRI